MNFIQDVAVAGAGYNPVTTDVWCFWAGRKSRACRQQFLASPNAISGPWLGKSYNAVKRERGIAAGAHLLGLSPNG